MDTERIAFQARKRDSDEALDLGLMMGRRWWWSLQKAWLATALPIGVLILLLPLATGWKLLLFWWFKPLYELAPLYLLSQRVFGEKPSARQLSAHWLKALLRWGPGLLTVRRFSTRRSFNMPLTLLEGLSGKARRARLRVLYLQGGAYASWLTFIGANAEGVLAISLLVVLRALVPPELTNDSYLAMLRHGILPDLAYGVGMALVAPFYVAGGFSLYLHRRIELEAWDIELVFRRLAGRLVSLLPILACGFLLAALSTPAPAQPVRLTPASARKAVRAVVAGPDFHHRIHIRRLRLVGLGTGKVASNPFPQTPAWLAARIAADARWVLWGLVVFLLGWVLIRIRRWLNRLEPEEGTEPGIALPAANDHQVEPEKFEGDVAALLEQGRTRESLAMLYRQVQAALNRHYRLRLPAGATESDCLERVSALKAPAVTAFFHELTLVWVSLAYAHEDLDRSRVSDLFSRWRQISGGLGGEVDA